MADCNQGLRPELLVLLMNQVLKCEVTFYVLLVFEIEGRDTVSQMKRLAIWGQLELSSKVSWQTVNIVPKITLTIVSP